MKNRVGTVNWFRARPTTTYLLVCFGLTWTVWFTALPLLKDDIFLQRGFFWLGAFGPAIAALVISWLGRPTSKASLRPNATYLVAFVVSLAAAVGIWVWIHRPGSVLLARAESAPTRWDLSEIVGLSLAAVCFAMVVSQAFATRSERGVFGTLRRWRAPLAVWLFVLGFFPGLSLLGIAMGRAWPPQLVEGVSAGVVFFDAFLATLAFGGGLSEEPGWRGVLLPELQRRYSPLAASFWVGLAWGIWHWPLYLVGHWPGGWSALVVSTVFGIALAVFFTWVFNRSAGSVLLVVLLHASYNGSAVAFEGSVFFSIGGLMVLIVLIFSDRMYARK